MLLMMGYMRLSVLLCLAWVYFSSSDALQTNIKGFFENTETCKWTSGNGQFYLEEAAAIHKQVVVVLEGKPHDKHLTDVALILFTTYLQTLRDNEQRRTHSLLFHDGGKGNYLLQNITEIQGHLCSLLSATAKDHEASFSINLDPLTVDNINITKTFQTIKSFCSCLVNKSYGDSFADCAKPLFKGCRNGRGKKRPRSTRNRDTRKRKGKKDRKNRKSKGGRKDRISEKRDRTRPSEENGRSIRTKGPKKT